MVARGPGRARPTRNILHETDMSLLPAIDLHLHIDGALRTETILDLAREQGIALPAATPAELEAYVRVSPNCSSLTEFLATFNVFYPLLKSPDALRRISAELMEDLDADGVLYAELRFAPALNLPHDTPPEATEAGMERVVAAVLEGMRDGLVRSRGSLIGAGLILCCYRGLALELAHRTVRVATRFSRETGGGEDVRLCGVDLAGDESRYPAGDFAEVFDFAPITSRAAPHGISRASTGCAEPFTREKRPAPVPCGTRWICCTPNGSAMGFEPKKIQPCSNASSGTRSPWRSASVRICIPRRFPVWTDIPCGATWTRARALRSTPTIHAYPGLR